MSDGEDDVNKKIFHSMAEVFQQAQNSYASHRKQIAILKKIQDKSVVNGYEDSFNYWMNRFVLKILPLKKNEVVGDRIVKLVAAFVASLDKELDILKQQQQHDKGNGNLDDSNSLLLQNKEKTFNKFIDGFIRYLLRGVESKDKNVRYRILQLLVMIMDNLGEIDEDLYNLLMWSLNKRIFDKESFIRTQAVFCLTKFQSEEDYSAIANDENYNDNNASLKLMNTIQNDPSADVRRAAMLNLINTPVSISYILERARDVNPINRRLVYSRILKSMGIDCFTKIDTKILNQLINWGLDDREDSVRSACEKLISYHWINLFNGDLIELLENLSILKSQESSYKGVRRLLYIRNDIINKLKFPDDIWKDFTIEIAFLFRCIFVHCTENQLLEILDDTFPEASILSDHIQFYIDKRFKPKMDSSTTEITKADKKHLDFIIEQLLITANSYDFSDEIGRRSMLSVVRNMLSINKLPEALIKIGHGVLKKISINERDFVTMAIEIINDLRDEDIELQEQEEKQSKKKRKNGNDSSDDDDDDDDDQNLQSFHDAVDNLVNNDEQDDNQDIMNNLINEREARPETIVICLTRSSCMLELVNDPLEQNVLIMSLIDTLITPAVRNKEHEIRELGVRNLGLCCLLDIKLAIENMYILGMCVSKGNAELKKIALQVIVDIFSVHGLGVVDGEGKVDSISLHKMFYKVLKNDSIPECQVIAAEGLCKLYLADIFTDEDLFETLVLSYFSPANSSNEPLIQAFAFCLPVYCFSHRNHQIKMSKIAADVLLRLCVLWNDLQEAEDPSINKKAMLKPNVIFQQLIHWTDPRKIVNRQELESERDNVQVDFVMDILKVIPQIEKKEIKKMLLTNINIIYITSFQDFTKLKDILDHVDDMLENEILDTVSRNALEKFKITVKEAIEEATERSAHHTTKDESEFSDEQISMILEESNIIDEETDDANVDIESSKHENYITTVENGANDVSDNGMPLEDSENRISKKRNRVEMEEKSTIDDLNDRTLSNKNVSFILPEEEHHTKGDSDYEMSD